MLFLTLNFFNFYLCFQLVFSNKLRSTNAQQAVWQYGGLTFLASAFYRYRQQFQRT